MDSGAKETGQDDRLVSWKRIAHYLQCSERTARRWREQDGLPVYQLKGSSRNTVFAYPAELDTWLRERAQAAPQDAEREAGGDAPSVPEGAPFAEGRETDADSDGDASSNPKPLGPWPYVAAGLVTTIIAVLAFLALGGVEPKGPVLDGLFLIDVRTDEGDTPDPTHRLAEAMVSRFPRAGLRGVDAAASEQAPNAEFAILARTGEREGQYTVFAQLKDRSSGLVLWSQTADWKAEDTDRLTPVLATQMTRIFACALRYRAVEPDMGSDVLLLYLKLCDSFGRVENPASVSRLLLEAQPESALAMGLHASYLAGWGNAEALPESEASQQEAARALALAQQALEIDPRNPHAHDALAGLAIRRHDWIAAEGHFQDAIAKARPDPHPANHYAYTLWRLGRLRDAIDLYRRAVEVEPLTYFSRARMGWLTDVIGEHRWSAQIYRETEALHPDQDYIRQRRRQAALFWRNPEPTASLEGAQDRGGLDYVTPCTDSLLEARLGRAEPETVVAACEGVTDPIWRMRVFAALGDVDRAFGALAEVPEARVSVLKTFYYPETASLRRDPRFWQEAARFGVLDYWVRTNQWPDFCANASDGIDCPSAARAAGVAG